MTLQTSPGTGCASRSSLQALLRKNHYTLGRKIGEGYVREVFEVIYEKGSLRQRRVAKIQKQMTEHASVQHRINMARGDLQHIEIKALGPIWHSNIVRVHDILYDSSLTAMIEEYFDAVSLEDIIRKHGRITYPERFHHLFSCIAGALEYLHVQEGMLHRDIKPSNILVGRQTDLVKLTDFQNAARLADICSKALPTRGGTPFTHPALLNGLVHGDDGRATIATEFYALGVTMYFALAKTMPFGYEIVQSDAGGEIRIGDDVIRIALHDGEVCIPVIDLHQHERQLERRMRRIPAEYHHLIFSCLSLERQRYTGDAQEAHGRFREDLDRAAREAHKSTGTRPSYNREYGRKTQTLDSLVAPNGDAASPHLTFDALPKDRITTASDLVMYLGLGKVSSSDLIFEKDGTKMEMYFADGPCANRNAVRPAFSLSLLWQVYERLAKDHADHECAWKNAERIRADLKSFWNRDDAAGNLQTREKTLLYIEGTQEDIPAFQQRYRKLLSACNQHGTVVSENRVIETDEDITPGQFYRRGTRTYIFPQQTCQLVNDESGIVDAAPGYGIREEKRKFCFDESLVKAMIRIKYHDADDCPTLEVINIRGDAALPDGSGDHLDASIPHNVYAALKGARCAETASK